MGKRIQAYFERADRLGGLVARMRLASLARVTSTEAATLADEPEILARLARAIEGVEQQFAQVTPSAPQNHGVAGAIANAQGGDERTVLLRRHLRTYVDLMAQRSLIMNDLNSTIRRIDEAASSTLLVQRVSVWFLENNGQKIRCADLYDSATRLHTSGLELQAQDYSAYFQALLTERTIAANEAHTDPRTSCFSEAYLKPLGITSMLDIPIWLNHRMVGVVCHEHVGPPRIWDSDEETFAYLMANFVAIALERKSRVGEA